MKESSIYNARRSTSFRILYCVLGRSIRIRNLTKHGKERIGWIKSSQSYRNFDRIDGEPMEFEWDIVPESIRCCSMKKSKVGCTDSEKHQRISKPAQSLRSIAEICEEYESPHERKGRLVVMGQSIVLSAIKTEVLLESDDPSISKFLLQQYEERIENCHNKIN